MAKASDNRFPQIILTEQGSAPANPVAGDQKLFIDSSDHLPYLVNSGGTVTPLGSGVASEGWIPITDTILASDTASFDFSSIPATYKHLALIGKLRSTRAASAADGGIIRINNDSGTNYDYFRSQINQTSGLASTEGLGTGSPQFSFHIPGATASAGHFMSLDAKISDYLSTISQKIIQSTTFSTIGTSSGNIYWGNSTICWRPASPVAVTRITILPVNGPNWLTGSRVTLFGIK